MIAIWLYDVKTVFLLPCISWKYACRNTEIISKIIIGLTRLY